MDNGEDIGSIMAAIDDYLSYGAHVGVYSEFHRPLAGLQSKLAPEGNGMASMVAFTQKQLQLRGSDGISKQQSEGDFLSKLLQLHSTDPEKVTIGDVFGTCMTNIGAGSDTTSISLGSVIYHLCRYPDTMATLQNEIDTMGIEGKISNPVTFAETQQMPYLQAVIKEALRMHPATGLPLGRVVPAGGKLIAGYHFPEKVRRNEESFPRRCFAEWYLQSIVGINSWVAHANTSVYGVDASIFRPERWLESKEKSLALDRYFCTVSFLLHYR